MRVPLTLQQTLSQMARSTHVRHMRSPLHFEKKSPRRPLQEFLPRISTALNQHPLPVPKRGGATQGCLQLPFVMPHVTYELIQHSISAVWPASWPTRSDHSDACGPLAPLCQLQLQALCGRLCKSPLLLQSWTRCAACIHTHSHKGSKLHRELGSPKEEQECACPYSLPR